MTHDHVSEALVAARRAIGSDRMSQELPDEAYAIALALQPDVGPAKLPRMLTR